MDTLPLQKLALHVKQDPRECEEANVWVTSSASASGRLQLQSIRPPQVPALPQKAAVWSPASPQLGGPALDLRLGDRWPAPGISDRALWSPSVWKLMELRIPLSRKSSRLGPGPLGPSQKGPFPLECGAWNLGTNAPEAFATVEGRWQKPGVPLEGRECHSKAGSATTKRKRGERRHARPLCSVATAHVHRLHGHPPV